MRKSYNLHFSFAEECSKNMRDQRFVAEHRGGPLKKEQHRELMTWAIKCTVHILPLFAGEPDERILHALEVAKAWKKGSASVGDARKASVACLALAREVKDAASINIVRAVGHAVATAHMADHALGPALYGLKAVRSAGGDIEKERKWQNAQLPEEIKELVLSARAAKEKHMRV